MRTEPTHVETEVLVIGAGGAGMYAAIEAARAGCCVLLVDRSLIGRGGATVMAQMTVAVALGSEVPDHWRHHFADTVRAGRALCDEALTRLLCEEGPECIREMDTWGVGWARKDGRIAQVTAPGHDRARCVYVDFINTGPAVSKTLRSVINRTSAISKASDLHSRPHSCRGRSWRCTSARTKLRRAGGYRCEGNDSRHRGFDAALSAQQRIREYGRRWIRAGAASRR
jgi:succinate dehydrogenase/fumarate reductase flavoprotein subunit